MTAVNSQSPAREDRLDALIARYLADMESGRAQDREQLVAAHPEFASELQEFFAYQDRLNKFARPLVRPEAVQPPGAAGQRFADYELIEEIGRGAMGVVYRARQISLNRVVALKMILAGRFASREDVERFRREAEVIASLDHPNILPIYEVGEHEGCPFFSMKLVSGGTLSDFAHEFRENPRAGARLTAALARAVHHAHQRGIVHRDLKPGNVLLHKSEIRRSTTSAPERCEVEPRPKHESSAHNFDAPTDSSFQHSSFEFVSKFGFRDSDFTPFISDFGLAKRLDVAGTLTELGSPVGTVLYMSPEAAVGQQPITTAADVYGLGAILHALLTGRPPFTGSSPLEILEQIAGREPAPMRPQNSRVDRDLETICLKCLAKKTAERYGSADALAVDLERWLSGKPILARPIGIFERVAKWAKRKPAVAALCGLTATLFLGGTAGVFWQWRRAERNFWYAESHRLAAVSSAVVAEQRRIEADERRAEAQEERERAETNFGYAGRALERIVAQAERLARFPGQESVWQPVLTDALQYYEKLLSQRGDDPEIRAQIARAYWKAGDLAGMVGARDRQEQYHRQAVALYEALVNQSEANSDYVAGLASCYFNLSQDMSDSNRVDDAVEYARLALFWRIALARNDSNDLRQQEELALAHDRLAGALDVQQRYDEAVQEYEKGLKLLRKLVAIRSDQPDYRNDLGGTLHNLASLRLKRGDIDAARALLEEAIGHERAALQLDSGHRFCRDFLRNHISMLGDIHERAGNLDAAIKAYGEAVDLDHSVSNEFPTVVLYTERRAVDHGKLGDLLRRRGRLRDSEGVTREAVTDYEFLAARFSKNPEYRVQLARYQNELGLILWSTGRLADAERVHRAALTHRSVLVQGQPDSSAYQAQLAASWHNLGLVLASIGRGDEAEQAYRRSLNLLGPIVAEHPDSAELSRDLGGVKNDLGLLLTERNAVWEARELLAQAIAHQRSALERDPKLENCRPFLRNHLHAFCEVLIRLGQYRDAASTATELPTIHAEGWQTHFDAACFLARCIPLAELDTAEPNRENLSQTYAADAIRMLQEAVARSLNSPRVLEQSEPLAPLRTMPAFQEAIRNLNGLSSEKRQ